MQTLNKAKEVLRNYARYKILLMSQPRGRFRDSCLFFTVACHDHEAVSIILSSTMPCHNAAIFKVENVYICDMTLKEKNKSLSICQCSMLLI